MNMKQIRELAEIVSQHGLTELEIEDGELRVRLGKSGAAIAAAAPVHAMHTTMPALTAEQTALVQSGEQGVDFNKAIEIKSSLIGVFYAAPAPDAEPFVKVGTKIKKGDVVCIIEAMKLMNEIVAEQSGEIVDVCVNNGEVVEFGQTLFKIC